MRTVRVFFFGDSICFGQGISVHKTWVTQTSKKLTTVFADKLQLVVQNPSINGNTTRMAIERMPYDVQAHRPHVLIVQFGMNDCNVWNTDAGHPRVSPAAFMANLSEIIERGRKFGAEQVILGVNHSTPQIYRKLPNADCTYDSRNRKYNSMIREVAKTTNSRVVDLERAFDACIIDSTHLIEDLVLADELHLSEIGHEIYFETYYPEVEAAVRAVAF